MITLTGRGLSMFMNKYQDINLKTVKLSNRQGREHCLWPDEVRGK